MLVSWSGVKTLKSHSIGMHIKRKVKKKKEEKYLLQVFGICGLEKTSKEDLRCSTKIKLLLDICNLDSAFNLPGFVSADEFHLPKQKELVGGGETSLK